MNGRTLPIMLLGLFFSSTVAHADFNRTIHTEACDLSADTTVCYFDGNRNITVSQDVVNLQSVFRVCLEIETVEGILKPMRVILAVDGTGSMCLNGPAFHNDVDNMRIEASNLFIDSLAGTSPESEIGSVTFFYQSFGFERRSYNQSFSPVPLNSSGDIHQLKEHIAGAGCDGHQSIGGVGKRLAPLPTNIGSALIEALTEVDRDFERIADSHVRHIILLTDGQWDDASVMGPQQVLDYYRDVYPGRALPIIHGVFLSDSAHHVDAGAEAFPYGEELEQIVEATGGIFINNAQPHNIVERLLGLLEEIAEDQMQTLESFVVTDLGTGQIHEADVGQLNSGDNDWLAQAETFPLQIGMNMFQISRSVGGEITEDTLIVNRQQSGSANPGSGFTVTCSPATMLMEMVAEPRQSIAGSFSTIEARVREEDVDLFRPATSVARVCRPYTSDDGGTLILHLDGNLDNAADGEAAEGNFEFSSSDALFNQSVTDGEARVDISDLQGDAVVAAWVKPSDTQSRTIIFRSSGYQFGMEDGYLFFIDEENTLRSAEPVDEDVWQHMAVVKRDQSIRLYVNGLAASEPLDSDVALGGEERQSLTIGEVSGYSIDEVYASGTIRTETVNGISLLSIPTVSSVEWSKNGTTSSGGSLAIASDEWQEGETQFSYTLTDPQPTLVHIVGNLHSGIPWSKMAEPVMFNFFGTYAQADFHDESGNGYLDRIVITLNEPDAELENVLPDIDEVVQQIRIKALDNTSVTLNPHELGRIDDRSFEIILKENSSGPLETGWSSAEVRLSSVPMTTEGLPVVVNTINDKAPAVIQQAIFYDAPQDRRDTVVARLSEPVSCLVTTREEPEEVFYYYTEDGRDPVVLQGASYATVCDEEYRSSFMILLDRDVDIFPYTDSLQLVAHAVDRSGNPPPSADRALKRQFDVHGKNDVVATIGPNPFVPTQQGSLDSLPGRVRENYANIIRGRTSGTIISVTSDKPLRPEGGGLGDRTSYGQVKILDAVGNLVRESLPLLKAETRTEYGVLWDGTNENGRIVGHGAYLVLIAGTNIDNKRFTEKVKVGVQR